MRVVRVRHAAPLLPSITLLLCTFLSPSLFWRYVFGLRANVPAAELVWDIRLLDSFGVKRYPFGAAGMLELAVAPRGAFDEPPRITASSNVPLSLVVRWGRRSVADGGYRPDRSASPSIREARLQLGGGHGGLVDVGVSALAGGGGGVAAAAPSAAP